MQGQRKQLTFLEMPVTRPLASISQLVEKGSRVVFDSEENGGSFIKHRGSGDKHKIYRKGEVFVLPIWIAKSADENLSGELPQTQEELGEMDQGTANKMKSSKDSRSQNRNKENRKLSQHFPRQA